jgi:hypothetical protein
MKAKFEELQKTGSVRFYEEEGFILHNVMELIEETLDEELYAYGVEENRTGTFLEVVKF